MQNLPNSKTLLCVRWFSWPPLILSSLEMLDFKVGEIIGKLLAACLARLFGKPKNVSEPPQAG